MGIRFLGKGHMGIFSYHSSEFSTGLRLLGIKINGICLGKIRQVYIYPHKSRRAWMSQGGGITALNNVENICSNFVIVR